MGILVISISVSEVVRDGNGKESVLFVVVMDGEPNVVELETVVVITLVSVAFPVVLVVGFLFVFFKRLILEVEALRIQEAGSTIGPEVVVGVFLWSRVNSWDLLPLILGVSLLECTDIKDGRIASLA